MKFYKPVHRRPDTEAPKLQAKQVDQHFETFREKLRARWPHGKELCEMMRAEFGPRALLKFSCGKDAIAAAIAMEPHFDEVVPLYLYPLQGLEFVEEALAYYEQKLFGGRKIIRCPHRALFEQIEHSMFMDPATAAVAWAANFPIPSYEDLNELARIETGLPANVIAATGVRYSETAARAQAISKYGPIMRKTSQWFPVWDWMKHEVFDAMRKRGIKLSGEYETSDKSMDGYHVSYLMALRQNYPRDWERICEFFPLIEVEMWRYERHGLIPNGHSVIDRFVDFSALD